MRFYPDEADILMDILGDLVSEIEEVADRKLTSEEFRSIYVFVTTFYKAGAQDQLIHLEHGLPFDYSERVDSAFHNFLAEKENSRLDFRSYDGKIVPFRKAYSR